MLEEYRPLLLTIHRGFVRIDDRRRGSGGNLVQSISINSQVMKHADLPSASTSSGVPMGISSSLSNKYAFIIAAFDVSIMNINVLP